MPVFEENWGCESSMTKDEKLDVPEHGVADENLKVRRVENQR